MEDCKSTHSGSFPVQGDRKFGGGIADYVQFITRELADFLEDRTRAAYRLQQLDELTDIV